MEGAGNRLADLQPLHLPGEGVYDFGATMEKALVCVNGAHASDFPRPRQILPLVPKHLRRADVQSHRKKYFFKVQLG